MGKRSIRLTFRQFASGARARAGLQNQPGQVRILNGAPICCGVDGHPDAPLKREVSARLRAPLPLGCACSLSSALNRTK